MITSIWDWIIILIILGVLLFGANKIPELFRNLGKAVAEFKKGQLEAERELKEVEESVKKTIEETSKPTSELVSELERKMRELQAQLEELKRKEEKRE